jgi:hypothetical protein
MRWTQKRLVKYAIISLILILISSTPCSSYSVLTHQAIIDIVWKSDLAPLIKKRFPDLTDDQMREAHAYSYGGCIIQDMGYYPFLNKFFTDLLHYVRSGDFVENMIAESRDANEYAFALGALSHYAADNNGHQHGTNRAVPIYFPELRRKYGNIVNYEQSPGAHIKAEFGFDVLQVAQSNYASDDYHNFIGFQVSRSVLERAFLKTYGLELKDLFSDVDNAISTYRNTASKAIPYLTKVAWETKKDEIARNNPRITRSTFVYGYSRKRFEKEFGTNYKKPAFSQKFFAFILRFVPKIGPFKPLDFKRVTPETESMFLESIKLTVANYQALLANVDIGQLKLENKNIDTGKQTAAGEYLMTDKTYIKLLAKQAEKNFKDTTAEMKNDLLVFFSNFDAAATIKQDKNQWRKHQQALERLKAYQPAV